MSQVSQWHCVNPRAIWLHDIISGGHLVCFDGCHHFGSFFFFLFFQSSQMFHVMEKKCGWCRVFMISPRTRMLEMFWNPAARRSNNLDKDLLKINKRPKNVHKIISHELWWWHELLQTANNKRSDAGQPSYRKNKQNKTELCFWVFLNIKVILQEHFHMKR